MAARSGRSRPRAKNDENLPKVRDEVLPPVINPMLGQFEQEAGVGFEDTGMDDYLVPFLAILQKLSPQVDEDSPVFIDGAKAGYFFNTASKRVYGTTVQVIPVAYRRMYAEWIPRASGGGFRGHHPVDTPLVGKTTRDDKGRFVLPNGNHLMDTRYHFVLVISDETSDLEYPEEALLALASSQIKKSRSWMTQMRSIRLPGRDGKPFTPPMYSHRYTLRTITESNDKGTWKGVEVCEAAILGPDDAALLAAARSFAERIILDKVTVDDNALRETAAPEEDVAF